MMSIGATIIGAALLLLATLQVMTHYGIGNDDADEAQFQASQFSQFSRHLNLVDENEDLPSLFPFHWTDYMGFGVAIIGLILAAGGGIGGGGILVPTYILLLNFPVKHAIPLASATVFGGAVANNLLNARKRHPDHADRYLIDWELILQLEPMTILGALIGANIYDFLPDIVLIVMMVLLLVATAKKTLDKAGKLHEKENQERGLTISTNGEASALIEKKEGNEESSTPYNTIVSRTFSIEEPSEQDTTAPTKHEPKAYARKQAMLAAIKLSGLFVVVTLLNLLKGGPGEAGGGPMGLTMCGAQCFWASQLAIVLVILLFAYHVRSNLLGRLQDGHSVPSDITWTERNTITYPLMAVVAGLVAGMFGVGGGIIKGPLMLALGVHPGVASATSACMILFTSSTATVSYAIFGLLVYDYAEFCILLGFCSTVVGQTLMTMILSRYQRNSYIAYSIGWVVAISALAMTLESVLSLMW